MMVTCVTGFKLYQKLEVGQYNRVTQARVSWEVDRGAFLNFVVAFSAWKQE